jgi:hypothetical protein
LQSSPLYGWIDGQDSCTGGHASQATWQDSLTFFPVPFFVESQILLRFFLLRRDPIHAQSRTIPPFFLGLFLYKNPGSSAQSSPCVSRVFPRRRAVAGDATTRRPTNTTNTIQLHATLGDGDIANEDNPRPRGTEVFVLDFGITNDLTFGIDLASPISFMEICFKKYQSRKCNNANCDK